MPDDYEERVELTVLGEAVLSAHDLQLYAVVPTLTGYVYEFPALHIAALLLHTAAQEN